MGLQPCDRSDKVPEGKTMHTLFMAGIYRGSADILVQANLALATAAITLQLTVRSNDENAARVIASAVG